MREAYGQLPASVQQGEDMPPRVQTAPQAIGLSSVRGYLRGGEQPRDLGALHSARDLRLCRRGFGAQLRRGLLGRGPKMSKLVAPRESIQY